MLTSFFGKSNPVNYLLLAIFIFLGFLVTLLHGLPEVFSWSFAMRSVVAIILCIFSMLLVDFIIRKNGLTRSNTYGILFFSCFLVMFPAVFSEVDILLANVFLLLGTRRILSLKSEKNTEKKVLDATLWITIAAFFYFYAILFFAVLVIAILRKKHTTYKHTLIPLVGFFGVFVVVTAYKYLSEDSFDWYFSWRKGISLDFSKYNSAAILIPTTVLLTLMVWTGVHRVLSFSSVSKKERPNYLLMVFMAGIAMVMALASPVKTGAEVLFLLAPSAIIITNYIENLKEFWFKELLVALTILLPIVLVFL
ncbi:DUF6427 family protein [Altibacter sp.]|uniref:DUF6427 family protein n=1 Tax=Altibacter sp. TaxID=2024823 RepID=UPI000C8F5527|nr:DUF6427 family protein [Altibacter sp.]MAP54398.1 hypothetical protein [Altibacter sp.]|tara:strand:+ start:519 stop:1442 length:924 start_codon:yes stop_codon:yes gene_type:complete